MCWLIVTMTALSLQLLSDILDINYTECLKLQLCIFTKKEAQTPERTLMSQLANCACNR